MLLCRMNSSRLIARGMAVNIIYFISDGVNLDRALGRRYYGRFLFASFRVCLISGDAAGQ